MLSRLINSYPSDDWSYAHRGHAYWYKHDYDRAISDYDQAIGRNPTYVAAYNGRDLSYGRKGSARSAPTPGRAWPTPQRSNRRRSPCDRMSCRQRRHCPLAIPLHSFRTRQTEGMGRSDERGVRDLGEHLQRNVVLLPADQVVTASRTSSRAWRVMASHAAPALQGRTYHAHDTPMQMVQYVEPALRSGQGGYSA